MIALIQLTTAGTDTGPFNLFSDVDFFGVPFEVGVTKVDLLAGYSSSLVPDGTTTIRVCSTSLYCANCIDIILAPYCNNCTCYTILSIKDVVVSYVDCNGVEQSFEYLEDPIQICAQNGTVSFAGDGIATPSGCCECVGEDPCTCPTTTTSSTTITV